MAAMHDWTRKQAIVSVASPWVTLHAERWIDDQGRELDYWRVERADSLIVMPIQGARLLVPHDQFRPGVNRRTLDLPGGRLPPDMTSAAAAALLLKKELGIDPAAIVAVTPLNTTGWIVNSSFSNQLLFGVVATIAADAVVPAEYLAAALPCDRAGLLALLERLDCLQCRAVVQEYLLRNT